MSLDDRSYLLTSFLRVIMDHQFLSECPSTVFFGTPRKILSDHPMITPDSHIENHDYVAIKPQGMEEVNLGSTQIRHGANATQEAVENEMTVKQNVEIGNDDDLQSEIIPIPRSMLLQEATMEGSKVIRASTVGNEVVMDAHLDVDRFIELAIQIGSEQTDDETFEDTKLITDTVKCTVDDMGYKCDDPMITPDSHIENHDYVAIKPQGMEEVNLGSNQIRHGPNATQEAVENEMTVKQNVEIGNDDDLQSEIIPIPRSMLLQEATMEGSKVIHASNVGNEVVMDAHLDVDRFIELVIQSGSEQMDDETFEDTKLITDTVKCTVDEMGYKCDDPMITPNSHIENHDYVAIKPQGMREVNLGSNQIRHGANATQEAVENEMTVKQNVEIGNDDDLQSEIIPIPRSMLLQEATMEGSKVIRASNVGNEVVMDAHLDVDRFIELAIQIGSEHMDDETFEDMKLITDTVKCTVDEMGYKCDECSIILKNHAALKTHIKSVHDKIQCSKSHKVVYKDDLLINKQYTCQSCPYSTQHRDELDKHVGRHVLLDGIHPSGKKRQKPDTLPQRHRYNAEEHRCSICSYSCTVYKAMRKHLKQHTKGNELLAMKISCKICGKNQQTDGEMQDHWKSHQHGKNFLCDICSFSNMQLKKVIQHRRKHTGEKPHLCPHCNYRSARRDNVRGHVRRMHKKETLYIDTFTSKEDIAN